jgi:multicomponent Na+:H+ antiporter subunit E
MSFFATFIILVAFWLFMSGLFDPWHFGLGIVACALVAYMSSNLLFKKRSRHYRIPKEAGQFLRYLPWLIYQICIANIYVVKLALGTNLSDKIDPHIVRFRTSLRSDLAVTTFANSITLTPGTITVLIDGDCFYVHALDVALADSLPGEMEERVAKIFGEE